MGILKKSLNIFFGSPKGEDSSGDSGRQSPAVRAKAAGTLTVIPEESPGPDMLKLVTNREFTGADQTAGSPLARALLGIKGIAGVEVGRDSVSIRLAPDSDRGEVMEESVRAITQNFNAGEENMTSSSSGPKFDFGFRQVASRSKEEITAIINQLFEQEINPAVAGHGGHFRLVDVKGDQVFVEMGGGCQGCGMAKVTLRQGVEKRLKEVLPEISELIDVTDHSSGQNPFYQK
ncbi:MAG: NifU family protein [Deltaproteobacteria bacterium]|nr:NifU family protein [Deltaproteobacteria bacterium]